MAADLSALWQFQQADMEVDRFEAELRASKRRQTLLKLRNYVTEQQKQLEKIEEDVQKMEERLTQIQAHVTELRAEFQTLQHQITEVDEYNQAKTMITEARQTVELYARAEHELSRMRNVVQNYEGQQRNIREKITSAKTDYDRIKKEYDEELAASSGELEALRSKRDAMKAGISDVLMNRYQAVKRVKTPPMAILGNDQCGGCNMSLPAVVSQSLRIPGNIVECENCGRILYVPENR